MGCIYEELMEVMKQGLGEVSGRKARRGQPWFTREMAKLRKEFHRAERDWLECDDQGRRKQKRREYDEKRRVYKKTVSRAKKGCLIRRDMMNLRRCLGNPKNGGVVQRKEIRHRKGSKC